jgi:hypothetical protein
MVALEYPCVGKTERKERMAYVERGTSEAVGDWLYYRGEEAGPLLMRVDKGEVYYVLQVSRRYPHA